VLSLAHSYALQEPGGAIVTADFNGDGNLDLMVFSAPPSAGSWGYGVLLGNGDGSFQPATFVSLNSTAPPLFQQNDSVVVADFNGDKNALIVQVDHFRLSHKALTSDKALTSTARNRQQAPRDIA
jgi:VCBS repeat protein